MFWGNKNDFYFGSKSLQAQPNSLGGIFTVRQKPPFMRDQLMASVSDFNSKRGFMVRSEGGRIWCGFNDLLRWVKKLGAFPACKYL